MAGSKQNLIRGYRRNFKLLDFENWSILIRSKLAKNMGGRAEWRWLQG